MVPTSIDLELDLQADTARAVDVAASREARNNVGGRSGIPANTVIGPRSCIIYDRADGIKYRFAPRATR